MIVALSLAVLLSPLVFFVLLASDLSMRAKVAVSGACLLALVTLPLLYFWFGSGLGI